MKGQKDVDVVESEHFGSYLKQGREARGLTLADISRATKIKESNLALLEQGRLEALPAEVFVIGFVRAYAREVGVDGNEAVRRYRRGRGLPSQPVELERLPVDEPTGPLHGKRFGVALVVFLILIVATLTLSLLLGHSAPPGGMS